MDAPDAPMDLGRAALDAACEALTRASLARWDALVRAHSAQGVPVLYLPESRAQVRQRWSCVPVANGAWALSFEASTLSVVFVRPDGTSVRTTPPRCELDRTVPGFSGATLAAREHDALVTCDNGRGAIVSVGDAGAITAPLPFDGDEILLEDVDRDGLKDVTAAIGGLAREGRWGSVRFVAHARPDGTFSLDDEVARVALRGQCPERPTSLLAPSQPDGVSSDEDLHPEFEIARRVVCARVWNVPVPAIAALLDRARFEGRPTAAPGPDSDAGASVVGASADGVRLTIPREELLHLVSTVRPPLHLRPMAQEQAASEPDDLVGVAMGPDAGAPTDAGAAGRSSAVARACEAAEARVRRLTRAEAALAGESATDAGTDNIDGRPVTRRMNLWRRALGRCVTAAGGAWVLALRSIERPVNADSSAVSFRARWAADFVTHEGEVIVGPEREALVDDGCNRDELTVFGTSDYDGDGRAELLLGGVHYWCGDGDGDNPIDVTVLTARGARVATYPPFAAVGAVQSARDFDRDGRIDLVDEQHWGRVECDPASVGVDDSPGPLLLWHSLPDGTFSRTDAVARAFLRRGECATAPRRIYRPADRDPESRRDGSDGLFRAVCARAHGWSAERVQLRALAELRAMGPSGARFVCNDFEWLSWRILVGLPATPR